MNQTGGAWTMASNRGPSAVNPPPNFQNDSAYYKSRDNNNSFAWAQNNAPTAGMVGGSWGTANPPATSHPSYNATPSISVTPTGPSVTSSIPAAGGGGTAISDGSYEKQLVMELCPPGGMKAEPPPDKLNQFARSVSNLNADLVCPVLLDCLEEGQPWIIRAKALWVIETCMKHGQKPGATSNSYTDFFHACSGEIAPLAQHNRAQIRDPAKRVMTLMGVAAPPPGGAPLPTAAARAAAAAPPPATVPNLLDFDDDGSAPSSTAPPAASASLFGGLNVTGSAAAPVAPPAANPPTAPPPPPISDNLLGDFGSDAAPPASAPPNAMGGDLFGDMMVMSAPAPAPATTSVASMFDTMSLKSDDVPAAAAAAPSTAEAAIPTGSAFGFMNQSSSSDSGTEKKTDTVPAMPPAAGAARDSFDPLKNVTPNTQKKMMQVSQEQMQAMMYQQMMMQQQQYMMAMQQQQRGGMNPMQMMNMMRQQQAQQQQVQGRPAEDKKFSFVQDAMSMEKKK